MNKSKGPGPGMKKWGCRSRARVIWGKRLCWMSLLGRKATLASAKSVQSLSFWRHWQSWHSGFSSHSNWISFNLVRAHESLSGGLETDLISLPSFCGWEGVLNASTSTGFRVSPVMCSMARGHVSLSHLWGKAGQQRGAKAKRYLLRALPGTALFASNSTQAHKTYSCPVPLEHRQFAGSLSALLGQIKVRMQRKGRIQESSWRKIWVCGDCLDVGAREAKELQVSSRTRVFSRCGLGTVIAWETCQPVRQSEEKHFR